MATYVSMLTTVGAEQLAAAIESNSLVAWSTMAVGDGGGETVTVAPDVTALVNETYSGSINSLKIDDDDASQVIVKMVIPSDEGGWTLREFGIFDTDGNLVVYGNLPAIVKPVVETDGTDVELTIQAVVKVGTDAAVTITLSNDGAYLTTDSFNNITVSGLVTGSGTYDNGDIDIVTTNVSEADSLSTARSLQTNLTSTAAASFDGTADVKIGVTGTLPIANGGTGNTEGRAAYLGSDTVGSGKQPIYLASGAATASTSTVGSSSTPVYLKAGVLTTCDSITDTKVTNTLATTTKAYVTGTTSSSTNTGTQVFDTGVYLGTTAGQLNATTFVGDLTGTASVASKLGTSTVGSGVKPIYLSSGAATASSSDVGSGKQPVYLSGGTLTASSSTVGDSTTPVYLSGGTLTASSSDVGSSSVPMYLASGVMTACGYDLSDLQSSLDTLSENTAIYIAASEVDSSGGYIKLSNGFIFQYGTFSDADSTTNIYLETAFTSTSYQIYFASSRVSAKSKYKAYFKISVSDDNTESGGTGTISSSYWAFGV